MYPEQPHINRCISLYFKDISSHETYLLKQLHDLGKDVAKSGSASPSVPLESVHQVEEPQKPKGIMGTLSGLFSSLPLFG